MWRGMVLFALLTACQSSAQVAVTDLALGAADDLSSLPPDLAPPPDLLSPSASCAITPMDQLYPGPLPPNPYGPAPAAGSCIAAPHDVIVVLGCPNNADGTPATCQTRRAEIAQAIETAGWGDRYITSGAAVHNAYVEADTLSTLLTARGVAASRITTEPLAKHTDENIYYSTKIMEANGWSTAWIVSEDPGHLVMTATCDSNCCVELGRMMVVDLTLGGTTYKVGHYVRYPSGTMVSQAECAHIQQPLKAMCTNLTSRLACADNFRL